ncbi:hypothetical protein E5720_05390 [Rhodococcus sp. PAMC28707]|uniref:hypothetical protein n=1 Tax=unclassified Rhodococcus (in: high G+C Gram-positive bacteria) TaxID=192944 RepID=UPI00109DCB91|nr:MULTISPECIES: hypothetical protein [unclassified Rhodococcus (in: high G+C Gram-positive bacteria)]QCB50289.1 hypothetical protein E5769_08625 [Rhodococcus sp. PAMC28705]QCB58019.1 hypothetical protein E5720_05390 [Rhodococcus sp. PAMC28707]
MISARLSVIDDIFLRTHRGFGIPIVLQGVWRSEEAVDHVELSAIHSNLSLGPLGRRVVTPAVPGARRRWAPSTDSLPLEYDATPLAASEVLDWADAQGECDLDPEAGPSWRLSARSTDNGGTVLSLVCSHVVADAAGLIEAARMAFTGIVPPEAHARPISDVCDAAALAWRVFKAAAVALVGLLLSRRARSELRDFVRASSGAIPHEVSVTTAVFDIDARLSNSEFISVVTEIMVTLGQHEPVSIDVPFRSNTPGANGIGMATVHISRTDSLAEIKNACKRAFTTPAGAPSGFPAEMVQLLPERAAAALTSAPGNAAALCSNIGDLPDSVGAIGSLRASTVATRALHPHSRSARTTTILSAYLSTLNGTSTLSLVGTDPALISSSETLADHAHAVLTHRQLTARSWR